MPAKRPAPKSAKGKKVASRSPVRKVLARKADASRARAAATHARKGAAPAPRGRAPRPRATPPPARNPRPPPPPPPGAVTAVAGRSVPPAAGEGDDGEAAESGSLLAGPRNVQPYIVKRGELYMSKEQLEHFRSILNS